MGMVALASCLVLGRQVQLQLESLSQWKDWRLAKIAKKQLEY
jgi:hypothetical protein